MKNDVIIDKMNKCLLITLDSEEFVHTLIYSLFKIIILNPRDLSLLEIRKLNRFNHCLIELSNELWSK